MITECEAKTKWCPEAVASHTDPRAGFHEHDTLQSHNHICIGTRCMAWRWFDDLTDDGTACNHKPTAKTPRIPEPPPAMGRPLDERRGYCGKAGAP